MLILHSGVLAAAGLGGFLINLIGDLGVGVALHIRLQGLAGDSHTPTHTGSSNLPSVDKFPQLGAPDPRILLGLRVAQPLLDYRCRLHAPSSLVVHPSSLYTVLIAMTL